MVGVDHTPCLWERLFPRQKISVLSFSATRIESALGQVEL